LDQTIMRGLCGLLALGLVAATVAVPSPSLQAAEPTKLQATEPVLRVGSAATAGTAATNAGSAAVSASQSAEATAAGSSVADMAAALVRKSAGAAEVHSASPIPAAAPQLIRQLDDSSFDVRQAAAQELERLGREAEYAPGLADQFQRLLCDERTSFEVRTQLAELMRHLPAAAAAPPTLPSSEIDHLLELLDDDSFAVRSGAGERLKWLARNPAMICSLVESVKTRLSDPNLSPSSRQQLDPLWTKIHGAWLLSDSAGWNFAPVPEKQIAGWIEMVENPTRAEQDGHSLDEETAMRELLDLLVRPDTAPAVVRALEARLADPRLDSSAASRLRELDDWSRPAMVAEYWDNHTNQAIQHLLVGVPSMPPGAQFPSHFDHCDDHVAHCVSGNSLSPGDYPVGIAFLHPRQPGAFFQLVNLPTTQRRLAYEFLVENETDTVRLVQVSTRTLNHMLEKHQPLDDDDLALLDLLDAGAVSRFAGPYFQAVGDGPRDDYLGSFGSPSRHGLLCLWLAVHGTHEAIGGLTEAIDGHRIMEPDESRPFRLAWVAAFAIAERDPWHGEDAWLAQRVQRTERLDTGNAGDVGAMAAAALLTRHGQRLQDFGLQEVESEPLSRLHLQNYRFSSANDRGAVLRWWSHQSTLPE
jgi:HEAT repeat protein